MTPQARPARLSSHPQGTAHLAHGVLHRGHRLARQGALVTEEHWVAAGEDADQGLGSGNCGSLNPSLGLGTWVRCVWQPTEQMGQIPPSPKVG